MSSQEPHNSTACPGAPEGYDELQEYFPSASARAEALGVERETIRGWDREQASRLRRSSRERVSLLLRVCLVVRRHMSDRRAVGQWMQTPHPGLYGATPVRVLLELGATGEDLIHQLAAGVSPVNPQDAPDRETFWRLVTNKLGDNYRADHQSSGFKGPLSIS